ncbi:PssD/Cps14F family polysaccharide biosynthesis glycosyltransferase [Planctomycetota bacterium]
MKICLVASAGGHMSQLLRLAVSWDGHDTFYVATSDLVRKKLQQYGRVYITGECNRKHPLRIIMVLLRCIKIVLRERPDVVISTGAAAGCIGCFLCKLTGAQVIWIDSITNVERLSLSGMLVRYIADLFIVQWPKLAEKYKNSQFAGMVI